MSTEPPPGGGAGGGIIDDATVKLLGNSTVLGTLPSVTRSTVSATLAKAPALWDADDRWYLGQALAWLVCNVK